MANKLIQSVVLGLSLLGAAAVAQAQIVDPSNPIYPSCLDNQRANQDQTASGINGAAGSAASTGASSFCSNVFTTDSRGDSTFETRFITATGCGMPG